LTLRTVAEIGDAIGVSLAIAVERPQRAGTKPAQRALDIFCGITLETSGVGCLRYGLKLMQGNEPDATGSRAFLSDFSRLTDISQSRFRHASENGARQIVGALRNDAVAAQFRIKLLDRLSFGVTQIRFSLTIHDEKILRGMCRCKKRFAARGPDLRDVPKLPGEGRVGGLA